MLEVKLQPKHHMKCSHDLWECTEKIDAGAFSASAPRAPYDVPNIVGRAQQKPLRVMLEAVVYLDN